MHNNKTRIAVNYPFFANKQCKSFHAVIETPYDKVTSKTLEFCATPLPLRPVKKFDASQLRSDGHGVSADLYKYLCRRNQHINVNVAAGESREKVLGLIEKSGGKAVYHQLIAAAELALYIVEPENIDSQKQWLDLYASLDAEQIFSSVSLTSVHQATQKECNVNDFKPVTHDSKR